MLSCFSNAPETTKSVVKTHMSRDQWRLLPCKVWKTSLSIHKIMKCFTVIFLRCIKVEKNYFTDMQDLVAEYLVSLNSNWRNIWKNRDTKTFAFNCHGDLILKHAPVKCCMWFIRLMGKCQQILPSNISCNSWHLVQCLPKILATNGWQTA